MNTTTQSSRTETTVPSFLKGRKALLVLGAVAGVTALAQPAYADISVCASGCDQTSIQAAINAAPDGGVIRLRPGIYQEKLVITDKALRLAGAGAAVTIIDGTSINTGLQAPVISLNCTTVKKIAIDGVTFTGGRGGLANGGCEVSLDNSLVTGNFGSLIGSKNGIYNGGTMTVWNTFVNNNNFGGIVNDGTLEVTQSTIINNYRGGVGSDGTLTGNNVTIANNRGGGISTGGSGILTGYRILNNDGAAGRLGFYASGGGVYSSGDLKVKYSLVLSNTAKGRIGANGGGIYYDGALGGNLKLVGDIVTRNVAESPRVADGGGLFNAGGTVSLTEGTAIVNNTPNNCNDTTCP